MHLNYNHSNNNNNNNNLKNNLLINYKFLNYRLHRLMEEENLFVKNKMMILGKIVRKNKKLWVNILIYFNNSKNIKNTLIIIHKII